MTCPPASQPPKAFISYSWDSPEHKHWTKELASRLRRDGINVSLDQWNVVPDDQLPHFMESAIRENDFVLIIGTPNYKKKSDDRTGGVGYEGDIMTAEMLTQRQNRKFIAVLRSGTHDTAMASWLIGKCFINLSENPYSESEYHELLITLHGRRDEGPPIGYPTIDSQRERSSWVRDTLLSLLTGTEEMQKRWRFERAASPKSAEVVLKLAMETLQQLDATWRTIVQSEHRLDVPPAIIDVMRRTREQFTLMIDQVPQLRFIGGGLQRCWNSGEELLDELRNAAKCE